MLSQLWEVAKMVIVASYRKNIIIATWLIMLPLLLAAWLFEISNPGFQSGFIVDIGSSLMAILSVLLLLVLSFEHLFWTKEQTTSWFLFSRLKSRIIIPAGKHIGISLVLLFSLICFAFLLFLLIGFTTSKWLFLPIKIAVMIWAEYSLLLSVLVLFSTLFSRLMSIGMMIPVFFISHSVNYIKSILPNAVAEVIQAFIPNLNIFQSVIADDGCGTFCLAIIYCALMSSFFIALAGYRLRSIDL